MNVNEIRILVIHGPNLNLVGKRKEKIYGRLTLDKLNRTLRRYAQERGIRLKIHQFNDEGRIVTILQRQRNWADGILLNPGPLMYTSYSIREIVDLIDSPVVEVHLSSRQRNKSVIAPVCIGFFSGEISDSYLKALDKLREEIQKDN
jgi:3-dehydroquinate dehydratase-2